MIIKSISMKNFQCYFGEHEKNTINFKKGLNLIIGHNGGGKSKFFDAFYWLLYDEIFESNSRKFLPTNIYKEALISDKAKFESEIAEPVTTEVILIVESTVSNKRFRLTRIYKSFKTDDRDWQDTPSRLLIEKYQSAKWVSVESAKRESILRMVIPNHLKPYMWFQGEQVDDLMDFTNNSTLTRAINLLSNIEVYDDFIRISKKVSDKSDSEYRKAQNRLTKDEKKSKEYNLELEELKRLNIHTEKNIIDNEDNYQTAKDKIIGLINQIQDAEEQTKRKEQSKRIKIELNTCNTQLENKIKSLNTKIFNDHWILMHSLEYVEKFRDKHDEYFKKHQEQEITADKNLAVGLDPNTPKLDQIKGMLINEKCFVCDRKAEKGTEPYLFIENLLNRTDEDNEKVFLQDCSKYFQKLTDNAVGFSRIVTTTSERIKKEFSEISHLKNQVDNKKEKLEEIANSFIGLIEDDKSESIVNEYKTHETNKEIYSTLLNEDKAKLKETKDRENELEDLLDKLVEGEIEDSIVNAKKVFNILKDLSIATRESVFHNLIKDIETKANFLFSKMAESNHAITGKIKFKEISPSKYIPEILGSDGNILSSPNDSNIILVKLALLMSILLSHGKSSENYTMILDAPTTKMDFEYTYGFYETLSNNFTQSIVMTYDFRIEEQRKKLKDFNIGSVHTIDSNIPNHDDSDRNSLETIIKEISL